MRTLTRILAPALAAGLALGAVAPASAADWRDHNRADAARYTPVRNDAVRADIYSLRAKIDRAAARRAISPREAAGLRRDTAGIERLYVSYARNGLNPRETQILRAKVDRVQFALRMEKHDRDGRRY